MQKLFFLGGGGGRTIHFTGPDSLVVRASASGAVVRGFAPRSRHTKVTPGSSFEQFMMGWSPRCYIPSFVKIGLPVLEKKIFEGFLPYMGVAAILVM